MKKFLLLLMALALVFSCENPSPVQVEMENYAKAHIATPDSFKFDHMGVEKEYKYVNDLYSYRQGLEEQAARATGDLKAEYEAEIAKVDDLFAEVGYDVACYEYKMYFWYMAGPSGKLKTQGVVLARYDTDGHLLEMTMDPSSLPTYPALRMLKDKGKL
ncbi:MAG: hypothetical protein II841_07705 [Bacteroidales bacterium]|nr:hypothetical protein [Bacteroidales bacterium]